MFGNLKHMGSNPVELQFFKGDFTILRSFKRRAMLPLKKLPKRSERSQSARGLDSERFADPNSTKYSLNCPQIWTLHFEADLIEVLDQSRFEPQVIPFLVRSTHACGPLFQSKQIFARDSAAGNTVMMLQLHVAGVNAQRGWDSTGNQPLGCDLRLGESRVFSVQILWHMSLGQSGM